MVNRRRALYLVVIVVTAIVRMLFSLAGIARDNVRFVDPKAEFKKKQEKKNTKKNTDAITTPGEKTIVCRWVISRKKGGVGYVRAYHRRPNQ